VIDCCHAQEFQQISTHVARAASSTTNIRLPHPCKTYTNKWIVVPPNALSVQPCPHPSRGGTPYSHEICDQVIWKYVNNLPLDSPGIIAMRAKKKFQCLSKCNNWISQYVTCGHINPKWHTRNRFAEREILCRPLELLALFWVAHPKATYAECGAYFFNTHHNMDIYSDSQYVVQNIFWIFHTKGHPPLPTRHILSKTWHFGTCTGMNNILGIF
jgi:hypothetical protein